MKMVRLIYASKSSPKMNLSDITKILRVARVKNLELGVTGLLCIEKSVFVQWLEGPRDAVNTLYATILKDERHERVTILDYSEVNERSFGNWEMGFVSPDHFDKRLVLKYSTSAHFEPFSMTSESVRLFLLEFGGTQKEIIDADSL